jgi:hypothetical protein
LSRGYFAFSDYPITKLYEPAEQYRRSKAGGDSSEGGKRGNEQSPLIPKKALATFGRGAVMGGI